MTDMQVTGQVANHMIHIEELESHIATITEEHDKLSAEHALLRTNSLNQLDAKAFLEQRVSELESLVDASLNQIAALQETIDDKDLVILTLNKRLLKIAEDNADLANKMMELKNDLIDAQVNYQCFDVIKVGRLLNSSARVRR